MQKLTKITASIGPNSQNHDILKKMCQEGVNVCRLNFSHDTGDVQGEKFNQIREIAKELGHPIAIIADLQGPKNRIGNFATEDKYSITPGSEFTFDNDPTPGDATRVQLPQEEVLSALKVGDHILLNDGKIEVEVIKNSGKDSTGRHAVVTRIIRGDKIWSRRGFNLPDTEVEMSPLTPKDRADLDYALSKNPDFVAISFVQKPQDVTEVREYIAARTENPINIIVKVERPQAVDRIEEIVDVADVIMVARGDLAVEMPFEQIPAVQRKLIRACRKKNKPIIVATQMLGSMMDSDFPTRAEISDVATTAYLRADSTMTSEETTIGHNPVLTIQTMAKILLNADMDSRENSYDWNRVDNIEENDWSRSIASMAYLNKAAAIVVFDATGEITTQISCRRPDMPIIAVCNKSIVANQLCICRGVYSIFDEKMFDERNVSGALSVAEIKTGKVVVVDKDNISLE